MILLIKNFFTSIEVIYIIIKPLITKNISTPRAPLKKGEKECVNITSNDAINLKNWIHSIFG